MTFQEYAALRRQIGPVPEVAEKLGVSLRTITGREAGEVAEIKEEWVLALRYLAMEKCQELKATAHLPSSASSSPDSSE